MKELYELIIKIEKNGIEDERDKLIKIIEVFIEDSKPLSEMEGYRAYILGLNRAIKLIKERKIWKNQNKDLEKKTVDGKDENHPTTEEE